MEKDAARFHVAPVAADLDLNGKDRPPRVAAGIVFSAYGVRVGIRVNQPDVLAQLPDYLPYGWKPAASPIVDGLYSLVVGGAGPRPGMRRFHLLYGGSNKLVRSMDLNEVFTVLGEDLQLSIGAEARTRLFVHAGVVGWQGRAILIPGRSFSGKTSLIAALVRAGATYYSDEYALLDARGRVHPYPRALSIRAASDGPPRRFSAEELGGVAGVAPLPVGLVLATTYRPGARWRPRRFSAGQAVLTLFANTLPARRRPAVALRILSQAVGGALALKGVRGDAEELAGSLLNSLDRLTA